MTNVTVRRSNWPVEQSGSGSTGLQIRDERHRRQQAQQPKQDILLRKTVAYEAGATQLPREPRVSRRQVRRIENIYTYMCAKVDPVMGPLVLALVSERPENVREAALNHLLSKKERIESRTINDGMVIEKGYISGGNATVESEMGIGMSPLQNLDTNGDMHRGDDDPPLGMQREVGRQDRLFMAREVGPLLTALISRTLRCMPEDVENFLIEELQSINVLAYRNQEFSKQGSFDPRRSSRSLAEDVNGGHISNLNLGSTQRAISDYDDKDYQDHQQERLLRRPSSARDRLEQAKSLDQHVQKTSPPLSAPTGKRENPGSPRPKSMQSDIPSGEVQPFSEALFRGKTAEASAFKETQNKPWDAEVGGAWRRNGWMPSP